METTFQYRGTEILHNLHLPILAIVASFSNKESFILLVLLQPLLHTKELLINTYNTSLWLLFFIYLPSIVIFILSYRRDKRIASYSEKLNTLKTEAEDITGKPSEINEDLVISSYLLNEEQFNRELVRLLHITKNALIADDVHLFLLRKTGFNCYLSTSKNKPLTDDGLIQLIMKEKNSRLIFSDNGEIIETGYFSDAGIRSLAVSAVVDEQVALGVLCAESLRYRAFNERDLELLNRIADLIALSLHRQRVLSRLNFSHSALNILHKESSLLAKSLDVEEMLKTTVNSLQRLSGAESILLWRRAASYKVYTSENLALKIDRVSVKKIRGTLIDRLHSHREGKLNFNNLSRFYKHRSRVLPEGFPEPLSIFALPLNINNRLQGIAMAISSEKNAFNQLHIHLIEVYLNQASESISKALLHEEIKLMAFTDGLTGLYNHRRFQERLDEEIKRAERYGEPLSLILLDIDHFKKVNDTYGHPAGDAVLKKLAELIRKTVREIDFPARYGGEEFALIILKSKARDAEKIAERLRKTAEKTVIKTDNHEITVTLSLGIASYPEDAKTREELIEKADQALYKAKHSGRNRTILFKNRG